jgi:acyl carrier protein
MGIETRLAQVFNGTFGLDMAKFSLATVPEDVSNWDSIGHMNLVSNLEREFGLQFEVDEIMDMASAAKIAEIMRAKGVPD